MKFEFNTKFKDNGDQSLPLILNEYLVIFPFQQYFKYFFSVLYFVFVQENKDYQKEFIKNLKSYRLKKKFSQAKFAELCSVSTGTIGNIECGLTKPSFDLIIKMAEVLEIQPALFFSKNETFSGVETEDTKILFQIYELLNKRGISLDN